MLDQEIVTAQDGPDPRGIDLSFTPPKGADWEMPPKEWGTLRSYLAKQGVKQADITTAVGGSVAGRKRGEICDRLRAWLRDRPRAK